MRIIRHLRMPHSSEAAIFRSAVHGRRQAVHAGGQDGPCARCDPGFHIARVELEGLGIHFAQHGPPAMADDGQGGGPEIDRRADHLVARLKVQAAQGRVQPGAGPVDGHGRCRAAVFGERGLKICSPLLLNCRRLPRLSPARSRSTAASLCPRPGIHC